MALQRQRRITDTRNITTLFSSVSPLPANGMTIRTQRTDSGEQKFSIIVPRSVSSSAVKRNTLKRKVSERLRKILDTRNVTGGARSVIVVRRAVGGEEIEESLMMLLRKSGIVHR